jgi:ATP-dependent Clp protease ATP-binding subunit ClpB
MLAQQQIGLIVSDTAKARLIDLGYDPAFGARPLKRILVRELQDPLAEALLRGRFAAHDTVEVGIDGSAFTFEKA